MAPIINYWAVLVAAIANMVMGSLWYGPLFGKQWMALSGISAEKMQSAKQKSMAGLYIMALIGAFLMAFVLDHSLIFGSAFTAVVGIPAGLMAAFWSWLGFIVPVTLGVVLWEGRPWKLWFLNSGYYLVSLCVMGAILAAWK